MKALNLRFHRFTAVLCAVGLCAALAGCGGSGAGTSGSSAAIAEAAPGKNFAMAADNAAESGFAEGGSALLQENEVASAETGARKIVYTASLSLESQQFDEADAAITAAVTAAGGYLESSWRDGAAEEGDRSASYTARIPVEQYSAFLSSAAKAGSLLSQSESAEDISMNYMDVEARLTALEDQRDRLNALADQAETTADLLEIESQLSNVQYQLESYTSQLNAMKDQVSYCTVELSLREVKTLSPTGTSFWSKLGNAFSGGWHGFVAMLQGLVLGIVYLLPLLVAVGIVWAIVYFATAKRRAAKKARLAAMRADAKPQTPPVPPQYPARKP